MPGLVQVNDDVYYLTDQQNFGIVRVGGGNCVVIDTGLDDEDAQKISAALEIMQLKPIGIINTHSHADHYGGNNYLVEQTGCKVYAPAIEAVIMTNPQLEPLYIYGANPPEELKRRFLMAKISPVDVILEDSPVTIGEKEFKPVPLGGHSPNQMGVIVDDVLFCADSVFSEQAWNALVLVYGIDIGRTIKSIEQLGKLGAKAFVPSHATPAGEIDTLADFNLTRIQAIADEILHILATPADTSTVLWELCKKHGLAMRTLQQYYLSLDTVKAYISYLLEQGLIAYEFDANRLMWRSME